MSAASCGTFVVTGDPTGPQVITDPDSIIEAWLAGYKLERVPAPPEACGCPRCNPPSDN